MDDAKRKEAVKDASLMHDIDTKKSSSIFSMKLVVFLLVFVILGVGTGYFVSGLSGSSGLAGKVGSLTDGVEKGKEYGEGDKKTFKDTAEGTLKKGGIEGEGQFHLERTGGESQNVYLTSSHVDLSKFVGKKIKVWGETFEAEKAGWLMDVGIVEVL